MEALIGVYQQGSIKRCAALDLSGNGIGDKGATALARIFDDASLCECLECLDLSRNRIRSKGFDALLTQFGAVTHKCLHTLVLAHNSPKTASIQCLCRNCSSRATTSACRLLALLYAKRVTHRH